MRHLILFSLCLLCTPAIAAYNSVMIEQAGGGNRVTVRQSAKAPQESKEQELLQQKNAGEDFQQQIINDPRISNYGRTKAAISGQFGEENAIPVLKTRNQRETAPDADKNHPQQEDTNSAVIEQSGDRNQVKSHQKGRATQLEVTQEGSDNQIDRDQEGDVNYFRKEQNGLAEEMIEQK